MTKSKSCSVWFCGVALSAASMYLGTEYEVIPPPPRVEPTPTETPEESKSWVEAYITKAQYNPYLVFLIPAVILFGCTLATRSTRLRPPRHGLRLLLLVPAGLLAIVFFTPVTEQLWPPTADMDCPAYMTHLEFSRWKAIFVLTALSGVAGIVAVAKRVEPVVVMVAFFPVAFLALFLGSLWLSSVMR